ncbi:MAG: ammonium transporter, partial [Chloroflexota bacterium]
MELYTIWILICAVLVFMMQIGFAFLECGFLDVRNAASIVFKNMMDLCFGVIIYLFLGSFIMWGSSPIMPSFMTDVESLTNGANAYAWILYHTAFAATAATIVSGAVAGRMKLSSYFWLTIFITGFIYPIVGRFVWNSSFGVVDLAGSLVVHTVGGFASLASLLVVKKRASRPPAHNIVFSVLGGMFLWVGWFGFNMGSVGGDQWVNISGWVGINTLVAACSGGITTFVLTKWRGLPVLSTSVNGVLGGLVSITASAHIAHPLLSIIIGALAGIIITWWAAIEIKRG